MPANRTSADVIAIQTSEEIVGIILEASQVIPELKILEAAPVQKTYYKTMTRTALPTAGFRSVGTGRVRDVGTLTQRIVQCRYLDGSWDEDEAYFTGGEWGDLELDLTRSSLLSSLKAWQQAIYNGSGGESEGDAFPGLSSLFPYIGIDGVVNAGGSTASTGSSIYLVKTGPADVSVCWGQNGEIAVGDVFPTLKVTNFETGAKVNARAQTVAGWAGIQLSNHKSVVRIANVTEQDGHTATDALIQHGIQTFAERYGVTPDAILMSYRSLRQLQAYRLGVNVTQPNVPTPKDVDGIPVVATLGIGNTEAILTTAS